MVSGAILGGAGEVDVDRLRKYSRSIGLAFQVGRGAAPQRPASCLGPCCIKQGELPVPPAPATRPLLQGCSHRLLP